MVLRVAETSQRALRCVLEYLYVLAAPVSVLATDDTVCGSAVRLGLRNHSACCLGWENAVRVAWPSLLLDRERGVTRGCGSRQPRPRVYTETECPKVSDEMRV